MLVILLLIVRLAWVDRSVPGARRFRSELSGAARMPARGLTAWQHGARSHASRETDMTGILAAPGPLANLDHRETRVYPAVQDLKRNDLLGRFEAWIYRIDGRIPSGGVFLT
jgi:hypothetical protein